MSSRHRGASLRLPWSNPLRYIQARTENCGLASHQILMRERFAGAKSLYRRDLKSHYGCVNAIEFSNNGMWIVSGGDDRRVLLWNSEKALSDVGTPFPMKGEHNSNIFCLAINSSNTRVYSGGNDEQVVVHDMESGQSVDVFQHDEAVYGLSSDPNNEHIFASACDDGRVLIYDTRESPSSDPFELAVYSSSMHAVMYNPAEPRLLATANAKEGLGLWDIRKPKECLMRYGGRYLQQSCMSVRINSLGTHLVALRRRLPPVLYEIGNTNPLCDLDHDGYYNSCTMKSCSFAGPNDEYVLSGSDDFNLYMWKIPDDLSQRVYVKEAQMILRGHRSIVNQVRYDRHSGIIISSGVEKVIKVWSPFPLKNGGGDVGPIGVDAYTERPVFTHEEYINLVLRSGLGMNHDYSSQSVEEDPRMMAFFDSLVQREHEYSSSDEEISSNELYDNILRVTRQRSVVRGAARQEEPADDGREEVRREHLHSSDSSDSEVFPFAIAFASVLAAQETDVSQVLDALEESERNIVERDDDPADPILRYQRLYGLRGRLRNRKSISEIIAHNRKQVMRAAKVRHRNQQGGSPDPDHVLSSDSSSSDSDEAARPSVRSSEEISHIFSKRSIHQQRSANRLKRLKALRERLAISDTAESSDDVSQPLTKRPRVISKSSSSEGELEKVVEDDSSKVVQTNGCDCSCNTANSSSTHSLTKGKDGFEKAGPCLQRKGGTHGHPPSTSSSHSEAVASTSGLSSSVAGSNTADHGRKSSDSDSGHHCSVHRKKSRHGDDRSHRRDSSEERKKSGDSHSKRKRSSQSPNKKHSSRSDKKSTSDSHHRRSSKGSSRKRESSGDSERRKHGERDSTESERKKSDDSERKKRGSSDKKKSGDHRSKSRHSGDSASNKRDSSDDRKNDNDRKEAGSSSGKRKKSVVSSESSDSDKHKKKSSSSRKKDSQDCSRHDCDSAGDGKRPASVIGEKSSTSAATVASNNVNNSTSGSSVSVERTAAGSSAAHENPGDSSDENSQPVWTEFKKFKKNLIKASRRHYRQQTSRPRGTVDDSTDDD